MTKAAFEKIAAGLQEAVQMERAQPVGWLVLVPSTGEDIWAFMLSPYDSSKFPYKAKPLYAHPGPDATAIRAQALEEAAKAVDDCDIQLRVAPGFPDGASMARRQIAAAIRALMQAE